MNQIKLLHKLPVKMMKYLLKNQNNNYLQKMSREINSTIMTLRIRLDSFIFSGLVEYEPMRDKRTRYIKLTDKGKFIALELIKIDRLLK